MRQPSRGVANLLLIIQFLLRAFAKDGEIAILPVLAHASYGDKWIS
jgi:hypothetical protein